MDYDKIVKYCLIVLDSLIGVVFIILASIASLTVAVVIWTHILTLVIELSRVDDIYHNVDWWMFRLIFDMMYIGIILLVAMTSSFFIEKGSRLIRWLNKEDDKI